MNYVWKFTAVLMNGDLIVVALNFVLYGDPLLSNKTIKYKHIVSIALKSNKIPINL